MNQFQVALNFYESITPLILAEKKNEWAVDPYAWDGTLQMTPIESAIWERIRDVNAVFYPQYPVGRFFADFANPVAKIAIECDGQKFHADKGKDAERDRQFRELGWMVYRIPGRLCLTEFNEEEMEEAFSMKLVRAISEMHNLVRGNQKSHGIDELMTEYMQYALDGKLELIGIQT